MQLNTWDLNLGVKALALKLLSSRGPAPYISRPKYERTVGVLMRTSRGSEAWVSVSKDT